MRPTRLQRPPQWRPRAEQMGLPHILIERPGPQAIGQRLIGTVTGRHCEPRPMTSTPGGGVNENRSAANFALREACVKVSWVT